AVAIEDDGARARRALVESEDERHGRPLYNAHERNVLGGLGGLFMRSLWRELLAEFFGTFILIVFGVGVVAQVVLSKQTAGTFLSINIGWGLAVTMGCYVSAGVTGAHLNRAVTLALAVHCRFPWNRLGRCAAARV